MMVNKSQNTTLIFFVNGKKIVDDNVNPETTLLQYLRENLLLPGTKYACGVGGCGACTVMVSKYDREADKIEHISVNACLCPVVSVHGMAVVTVEGIGSTITKLHPIQERIAKSHGSQCGFCTPGFVMSMYALLRTDPRPSLQRIEENLIGNLCRCTGYRPIIEGLKSFSNSTPNAIGCGIENCCMLNGPKDAMQNGCRDAIQNGYKDAIQNGCKDAMQNGCKGAEQNGSSNEVIKGNDMKSTGMKDQLRQKSKSTQEVIFPPELMVKSHEYNVDLAFIGQRVSYYRPTTLQRLLELKKSFPNSKLVCGNTEIGIEVKLNKEPYPVLINPTFVTALSRINQEENYIEVGGCATLSKIEDTFNIFIKEFPEWKVRPMTAIVEMLKLFAGKQIRNVATIAGNLMTASPISDLIPILVAAKAQVILRNVESSRSVIIDNKFFTGYRKNIVSPDEIITSIRIPYTDQNEFLYAYKNSKRKDDGIAIVNAAMLVGFIPSTTIVQSATLAFGGMALTVAQALKAANAMKGMEWNEKLLRASISNILDELKFYPSAERKMMKYRETLAASFFYKYFLTVKKGLHKMYPGVLSSLTEEEENAIKVDVYCEPQSWQLYDRTKGQNELDPIGKPIVHISAYKQASGEAIYVDDLPKVNQELFASFVMSTRAKAKLVDIDESAALQMEGVRAFYCAKDIPPERNHTGFMMETEVFVSKEVACIGQIIGIILADNQQQAKDGARAVKITYEETEKPIITLEEAIEKKSMDEPMKVEIGDPEDAFVKSTHVLEGEVKMGGQEHFYMETYANLMVPNTEGELEIFCSTQCPTLMQALVAFTLGIPQSNVNCKVKRIGGGFGGKAETALIVVPLAVAAYKLGRPIRSVLERDEDMLLTGGRHPILAKWKVGFTDDGRIISLRVTCFVNGGYVTELSTGVVERFVLTFANSYSIPNAKIDGYVCKTNLPSNTAFRGFGAPQSQLVMEEIMATVASFLGKDPYKVRELNLIREGEKFIYGQPNNDCSLRRCWNEVILQSDYHNRVLTCDEFNRKNTFKKRGINVCPGKFSVGFPLLPVNQAAAVVSIYADGSVLLNHGGVEIGQGLYTKMIQVAAKALDISIEKISTVETSTYAVPNGQITAASFSSDLNGMAVLHACKELKERLEPYRKRSNNDWEKAVMTAYMDRVCLFANGFYKVPHLTGYDFKTGKGEVYLYYSGGAAVTEVEIDCLTGHHQVLQTDIVMDVGNSLNPAIDIGQIEGAFVQGMGLLTIEELVYSREGDLLTNGPGTYKIPSILDVPRKFNVSLLRDSPNVRGVYSSRAVGEPPLVLGSSVFFAIRQAIEATRKDNKLTRLDAPATAERIRLACQDWITDQCQHLTPDNTCRGDHTCSPQPRYYY